MNFHVTEAAHEYSDSIIQSRERRYQSGKISSLHRSAAKVSHIK